MESREEIAKCWRILTHNDGFTINNDVLNAMQEYSDQQNKQLLEEIDKLKGRLILSEQKVKLNYNCIIELQSELKDKDSVNEKIIESLNYVRNNPKTWKAGGIGGQDQYAGMPSMLRYIDEIISNLTNQNK